jgi:serine/threonine protein kinase
MIGQTISHYKILEKLGEGGMGVVYKAEDTELRRTVALKFLSTQAVGGEGEETRFIHEAQAAAAIDHTSICTVYEIGKAEDQTFIAMAYIEGESLKEKIETGPMGIEETLRVTMEIAEGLQEAHEKGIIHRDIKPANVMITVKGQAKAGNTHCRRVLVEAAWNNRHRSGADLVLSRRRQGQPPAVVAIAIKAQHRLYKKFWRLDHKKHRHVAITAFARELCGFVWAILNAAPQH